MDFFDNKYYIVQKRLLILCGGWPYNTNVICTLLRIIFINGIVGFMLLPELIVFIKYIKDFDFIMECLPLLCSSIMGFAKATVLIHNADKVKVLLEELKHDWKLFGRVESEILIIEKYAQKGKMISTLYASCIYVLAVSYYCVSYVAPVLDLIMPLNESRHRLLIYPGDFYIHMDSHFFLILTMEWYGLVCAAHVVLALDSLYMTLMLHSCGMFAILSDKLEKLQIERFRNDEVLEIREDKLLTQDQMIYIYLIDCVKLHLKCIKYAEYLNATFNIAFFTDLAFGVLLASASAVKFVLSLDQPNYRFKYGALYIVQSLRIFCNSYPGQLLIDHSSYVNRAASKNKWYELPEKSKKLLLLLLLRSKSPSEFVVAKMFTMNIQLFSTIVRTCVSYCTVLLSAQNK